MGLKSMHAEKQSEQPQQSVQDNSLIEQQSQRIAELMKEQEQDSYLIEQQSQKIAELERHISQITQQSQKKDSQISEAISQAEEWKDIVYHKYNDDRTSYECVPCYNSVDEYIASEKEDLESYKADLEEALEELKDMRADWKPEKEPNMDEEIELIKKWVKEREDFINE